MKQEKVLNEILGMVTDISKRVEALESVSHPVPQEERMPDWLRQTYPEGYLTMGDFFSSKCGESGCHQILAGMVIGDCDSSSKPVIRPIVPMMFHDGELGYAYDIQDGRVCFDTLRQDLPVLIGDVNHANGMYVPFNASERGIDVAQDMLDDMRAAIKEENACKPYIVTAQLQKLIGG